MDGGFPVQVTRILHQLRSAGVLALFTCRPRPDRLETVVSWRVSRHAAGRLDGTFSIERRALRFRYKHAAVCRYRRSIKVSVR